jgi:hypothetical protein
MARAIAILSGSKAALLHSPLSAVTQYLAAFLQAMTHDAAPPAGTLHAGTTPSAPPFLSILAP